MECNVFVSTFTNTTTFRSQQQQTTYQSERTFHNLLDFHERSQASSYLASVHSEVDAQLETASARLLLGQGLAVRGDRMEVTDGGGEGRRVLSARGAGRAHPSSPDGAKGEGGEEDENDNKRGSQTSWGRKDRNQEEEEDYSFSGGQDSRASLSRLGSNRKNKSSGLLGGGGAGRTSSLVASLRALCQVNSDSGGSYHEVFDRLNSDLLSGLHQLGLTQATSGDARVVSELFSVVAPGSGGGGAGGGGSPSLSYGKFLKAMMAGGGGGGGFGAAGEKKKKDGGGGRRAHEILESLQWQLASVEAEEEDGGRRGLSATEELGKLLAERDGDGTGIVSKEEFKDGFEEWCRRIGGGVSLSEEGEKKKNTRTHTHTP